jgi:ribosomal protein S18 acetylase RimI-like enzyme
MRVRPATSDDLDTLVELAGALFREDAGTRDVSVDVGWPIAQGRPYYAGLIDDGRSIVVLIQTTCVVGFLIGRLAPRDPLRPDVVNAELESMYVIPEARSRGGGRLLVEQFGRWTATHGATHTTVTAYATNPRALRFYRALGFEDRKVTLERQGIAAAVPRSSSGVSGA